MLFRVAQLNILNKWDIESRYRRAAEALASAEPDFITVQELIDPVFLSQILKEVGFQYAAISNPYPDREEFLGIFSREPISEISESQEVYPGVLYGAQSSVRGTPVNLYSAHFTWGPESGAARLAQAQELDRVAKRAEASGSSENSRILSVLGGDLNGLPESQTLRYLRGLAVSLDGSSTTWTDAAETVGDLTPTTGDITNEYVLRTAERVRISRPDLIPSRRIDYVMTRGWNHGRAGTPIHYSFLKSLDGLPLSDHEGLLADFLL